MDFSGTSSLSAGSQRVENKICEHCRGMYFREYQEMQLGAPPGYCQRCVHLLRVARDEERLKPDASGKRRRNGLDEDGWKPRGKAMPIQ